MYPFVEQILAIILYIQYTCKPKRYKCIKLIQAPCLDYYLMKNIFKLLKNIKTTL